MTTQWTDFAWQMLSQTADYILSEYGTTAYATFLNDVDNGVRTLMQFPQSGHVEPLLKDRIVLYRSIVINNHNKLVYFIDEEKSIIQITDFWDTRREPSLLIKSI
ncbi:MAG: type II toxin-antitoxin system RelE/ParE family toxin [Paludibacteraceae bacterium]|nr:type II toxin-antitoxin system RelE/ParE family toxin [Paludibacteraceae bacterium]